MKLPLTTLNYLKCGKGEPLIIVPATISEIDNWLDLIQYFGQRFTVIFFELPGHGKSTPFNKKFSSDSVALTVKHLIDNLGYEKINLMGFSFGGILTLKTLNLLRNRIKKVVLFAPCVTHRALTHNKFNLFIMHALAKIMQTDTSQKILLSIMHNRKTVDLFMWFLKTVGHVEIIGGLKEKLLRLKPSTLDVLVYQINEILSTEFNYRKFNQKVFFGMSTLDPLLSFKITKKKLQQMFRNIDIQEFDFPYHQPKNPFTFDELNRDFGNFVHRIADAK